MTKTFPFGNPEGSRSDIQDVIEDFVTFDDFRFGPGLGTEPDKLSIRVIVGTKGSGKTVYLRRLQASASSDPSLYADVVSVEPPSTSNVVRFCQCFKQEFLTEKWGKLWYCSIMCSVASHLLCSELSEKITDDQKEELQRYVGPLLPECAHALSIYSQVVRIINAYHTDHQFSRYFDHPKWPELEALVVKIVRNLPPIYLFVDSIDEEYANAPMYWLRCQQGLFFRTMRFLQDPRLGGRLHVTVCLRDQVLSSILMGEHANRYRDDPHIRFLAWNYSAARFFLEQKLLRLPEQYFMREPNGASPAERWLGISKIQNLGRNIKEDIVPYLLRHTRLLPRDIVMLGNHLCREIRRAKAHGGDLRQEWIRKTVRDQAIGFGNEQLAICASQIISSGMPSDAARQGYSEIYTGDDEYRNYIRDKLKEIILAIGRDRFSRSELQAATALAKQEFGNTSNAFSVLWQNRLLGYVDRTPDGTRQVFFSERDVAHFKLPQDREEYLFHSCIIDSVGVRSVGTEPVGLEEA